MPTYEQDCQSGRDSWNSFVWGFAAQAQGFPDRPIRLLIGIGAGGVADAMTRVITDEVSKSLGQPIVIENVPGSGGDLALDNASRASPDSYTLVLVGPALVINRALKQEETRKDLVALTPIRERHHRAHNIKKFIYYAKQNGGKLNYASVRPGTAGHLAAVLLNEAAGLDMVHIPYRNVQQASTDLISGKVPIVFNAYPPIAPLVSDNKLKLFGFTTKERIKAFLDVPTISESGLSGFEVAGWYMLLTHADAPRPVVERLNAEFTKALRKPEVVKAIENLGLQPNPLSLAETENYIASEYRKWSDAVAASGMSAK